MDITNNIQVAITKTFITNPGFILTRPFKPATVQSGKKIGLNVVLKKTELEPLEVIVGNGGNLAPGVLKIKKGDVVYVKSDRYTQPWASEVIKAKGIEEIVDGKVVQIEFISVPIGEVVVVTSSMAAPVFDWEKFCYWPYTPPGPNNFPPYYGVNPLTPYVGVNPPTDFPCPPGIYCSNSGNGGSGISEEGIEEKVDCKV